MSGEIVMRKQLLNSGKLFALIGIDNLFNYKYTMFHPFPQRTLLGTLKYSY